MNKKIGFASMNIALIMRMTWTLSIRRLSHCFGKFREACENALEREGKFDARGELDSDHPSIHPSIQLAIEEYKDHQGVIKSMGTVQMSQSNSNGMNNPYCNQRISLLFTMIPR